MKHEGVRGQIIFGFSLLVHKMNLGNFNYLYKPKENKNIKIQNTTIEWEIAEYLIFGNRFRKRRTEKNEMK